jgi:Gpi18-like mannosyltransferase
MKYLTSPLNNKFNIFLKPRFQLFIFLILNFLFFVNIYTFHSKVEFHSFNYRVNAHHFIADRRVEGKTFNLINALGQYDAQWYLKIAKEGYPVNPPVPRMVNKSDLSGLTYAFFPLYPLVIKFFNFFFKNVELSAFLLSLFLIFINYGSLLFIVKKHFNYSLAVKTSFLLFFFPFAVFFRSYFTEGLYLFLLLWFSYFLFEKKYIRSSFFLSLLNITKANGFLLNIVFVFLTFRDFRKRKIKLPEFAISVILATAPFLLWMCFNYLNTGNFIYFLYVRSFWSASNFTAIPFLAILHNIALIILFPLLPLHAFHTSEVDLLTVLVFFLFLIKNKKILPKTYWLIALSLWLSPLLVTDTMSFSRYQSVNFPIFIYLAHILKGKPYAFIFFLFLSLFAIVSLFFVNWWWVG